MGARTYTKEESSIIMEAVKLYPTNLQFAFKQASLNLIRRSLESVQQQYYKKLRAKDKIIAIGSEKGLVINIKNTPMTKGDSIHIRQAMLTAVFNAVPKEKVMAYFISKLTDKEQQSLLERITNNL